MRNVRVFAAKGSKSRRKISCEIRHKSVILPKGLIACVGVGRCGVEMPATPPNSAKRPNENAHSHRMSYFLQHVAHDLRTHFTDLSRVVVLFPNRRAGLFLNDYLVEDAPDDAPIWAPRYVTISELFRELSDLTLNDPVDSVCRLYAFYVEMLRSGGDVAVDELTLDTFYGWADRILADFDDVDKNMADASQLFRNLEELKELDDMGFLDDAQKKLIGSFFSNFDPDRKSELRERFRRLWNALLPLYRRLNAELLDEGKAYEGALYRRVAEALAEEQLELPAEVDCYAVVGFNVLDKAEQRLFEIMKKAGKARFYWDYDQYYANPYRAADRNMSRGFEAGLFIEENLRNFPNALPAECFDNFRNIEQIEMVSATSEAAQAQSVSGWLNRHLPADETAHRRTAVVLCNENLLQPVLRVFPTQVQQVNVTKGFPLAHAEVNTLVEKTFAEFERSGQSFRAIEMLNRLSESVEEKAKQLCAQENFDTTRFEDVLQSEAFYLMATLLNRLRLIAADGRLEVGATALRRVVRQIVRQTTVPFHGEPAVGLQVLGVLETRCLDFDNVLMLSVNENTLPQTPNDNSFIPYMLRKAFGLTTPERRTAVYAYYFYRLIQRARHLRMTFNCSAEGLSSGEMSRFMTQLRVDTRLPISDLALQVDLDTRLHTPEAVEKPHDLVDRLYRRDKEGRVISEHPALSPSAINTYLRCQLRFYYEYVCKFRTPQPTPEDGIQPNLLGTIFHAAAEAIYQRIILEHGGTPPPGYLKALAIPPKNGAPGPLHPYIEAAFVNEGFDSAHLPVLEASVVEMYLRILLEDDVQLEDLQLCELEQRHTMDLPLPTGSPATHVTIGGIIDRVDRVTHGGRRLLRILDYKTGGSPETAADVAQLFEERGGKHRHYMLQTFIYAEILRREGVEQGLTIAPALYFVHHARGKSGFTPYLSLGKPKAKTEVLDFAQEIPDFSERLTALVAEILDPDRRFAPLTDEEKTCKSCPFYALCYR